MLADRGIREAHLSGIHMLQDVRRVGIRLLGNESPYATFPCNLLHGAPRAGPVGDKRGRVEGVLHKEGSPYCSDRQCFLGKLEGWNGVSKKRPFLIVFW